MSQGFAVTTRSLFGRLAQIAQRLIDGGHDAAEDEAPSPAARIDHPTYLRRRLVIDGVAGPCNDDWATPSWQVRLPH